MIKIQNGGIEAIVEDWPGRLGYMGLGMAAAGAMDNLALQLGNLIVGNKIGEAGIEVAGGYFQAQFEEDMVIAVTGTDMNPTINDEKIKLWESFKVNKGDVLKFSHFGEFGFRCYICVAGGVDVPEYLGSKSTCVFGSYGGFEGRRLVPGDKIKVGKPLGELSSLEGRKLKSEIIPEYSRTWELRAIPGMNSVPDYVTEEGMDYLFSNEFKVSYSSNRSAYRISEIPSYFFSREDGGKGGSHPSNIVDHGYNMRGAINICGNTPIILIADGPTLGGYICVANIINADLWKIGQGTPSRDYIKLVYCTRDEAVQARIDRSKMLTENSLL
ncbi:biotin-dependent carboxyltransferase family protein [Clostridium kluyveri]|uniref:Allophanate hydrolase n=1 Tax=Clostridium kluyveri TaxID=1534 RepID=A0A1L5F4C8_CLOKL|nr:biotin-dependent carboxyltransferase family protein [Clostridium kluyveri]APM37866.1 allophanate hydrolase [Clostridium kluyveri]